jgi:hypothetical protein
MSFDAALELSTAPFSPIVTRSREPRDTAGSLERHDRMSPRRPIIEEYIRTAFAAHFGAHVRHFMPDLLLLPDTDGGMRAVVGCRAAALEPLFLETYTREPIEIALASRNGFFVPREQIVEIGSLACRNATASVAIVRALVPYLLNAGFSWVVFTGTDTVINVFRHLGLAPCTLCPAHPLLLGEARHDWGTYYDHAPHVMAGRIADGMVANRAASRRR